MKSVSSRARAPDGLERPDRFVCSRCGEVFKRQKGFFPTSVSPLHKGNGGYMTICNNCLDALYDHYRDTLGDDRAAIERMCLKLDIYWNPAIMDTLNAVNTTTSRIRQYLGKSHMLKYNGRTYDDTLDEQANSAATAIATVSLDDIIDDGGEDAGDLSRDLSVDKTTVLFWGAGFSEADYHELNLRYDRWTRGLQAPLDTAEEALYKQVCIQELQINRNIAAGKPIEQGQNALNNLLSSLNMKPSQKKDTDEDKEFESTPLGVWAKRWEDERPIPEYEDDAKDEPGLIKYITTWFFGHCAKALGLRNMYSQVYEDEIEKYRIARPEFENEDDDAVIADIVDSGGDGS